MKKIISFVSSVAGSAAQAGFIVAFTTLASFVGTTGSLRAADYGGGGNPWIKCEVKSQGPNVTLRWFGEDGVPCQVETSTDLLNWTESGPIIVGSNAWVSVAQPSAGTNRSFFRVKDFAVTAESSGAVVAFFQSGGGVLAVFGTGTDNNITVSRNAAGQLLVNGGAVAIRGGTPTVANVALIQIFGLGGNDALSLNEANGALPRCELFGGTGNDTLTAGSGDDSLFGEAGSDILFGRGGNDLLFGGSENDTVTGGDDDDSAFLQSGNDRFIWNPGDDTDLVEGGDGTDTAEVNGGNGLEEFTTVANGTRVRFDRLNPAPFSLDLGTCENLVLNANGGDDSFSATGNLAALILITVDGGSGNDTLFGSNGVDVLLGGDGDDFIDGQQGNDVAFLGAGNDTFQWDPGDGSDVVEGQGNSDTLRFNGSNGSEIFEASANGNRVRFVRNLGNIVMDLSDVEQIDLRALGGADTITVNDLSGTDLLQANVQLAGTPGGTTGDVQPDAVLVNGSNGNDIVDVLGAGTSYSVVGLAAVVSVSQSEGTNDTLVINTLGGNDGVSTTLPAGIVKLTIDGGAGNDTLIGSAGVDVLLGGDNDDFIDGQQGNDVARLGAGNDVFQWDPGDGSDIVEGQTGFDRLLFNGANINENIDITANGSRVRFFRNIATITMDLDDVERIDFNALAGADNIVVGDLTGTDTTQINLRLAAGTGLGDAQPDTVTAIGSATNDVALVSGDASGVRVDGLATLITITGSEPASDRLTFNFLGGDDLLEASNLPAGFIQLTADGGNDDDVLVGSAGPDVLNGGAGDDVLLGGPGLDVLNGGTGDNLVVQD